MKEDDYMKRHVFRALDKYYLTFWGESDFDEWWVNPDEFTWKFDRGNQTVTLIYNPETKEVEEHVNAI